MPEELVKDILVNTKVTVRQDTVCLARSQPGTSQAKSEGLLLYTIRVTLRVLLQMCKHSKFELTPSLPSVQPVPRLISLLSDCRFLKSLYGLCQHDMVKQQKIKTTGLYRMSSGHGYHILQIAEESPVTAWL